MKKLEINGLPKFIGGGGNNKVYECNLQNETSRNKIVIKTGGNPHKNLENYKIIREIGLPTLSFAELNEYNGKTVFITEHLNTGKNKIFVSPNSVISDEQKYIYSLDSYISETRKNKESPIAEKFRYENKLVQISNFTQFITNTIKLLKSASEKKVLIEFDSYFIGSNKTLTVSDIDFVIGDFDNIFIHFDREFEEIYKANISEFQRLLNEFVRYFVEPSNDSKYYKEELDNIEHFA